MCPLDEFARRRISLDPAKFADLRIEASTNRNEGILGKALLETLFYPFTQVIKPAPRAWHEHRTEGSDINLCDQAQGLERTRSRPLEAHGVHLGGLQRLYGVAIHAGNR